MNLTLEPLPTGPRLLLVVKPEPPRPVPVPRLCPPLVVKE